MTALRSRLPMELEWMIRKCLAKNPAERYQHVDDLIVDLTTLRKKLDSGVPSGVLAGMPQGADQPPAPRDGPRNPRTAMRNAILFAVVILAAVGITLVAAGGSNMSDQKPPAGAVITPTFCLEA